LVVEWLGRWQRKVLVYPRWYDRMMEVRLKKSFCGWRLVVEWLGRWQRKVLFHEK